MRDELKRDFTFEEWETLAFEEKRDIWNHYWNPYESNVGKKTRDSIISAFKIQHTQLCEAAIDIGFGYFGFNVGCIYIVLENSKKKVPRHFSDVSINKGIVIDKKSNETYIVKWRDVGGTGEFTKRKNL